MATRIKTEGDLDSLVARLQASLTWATRLRDDSDLLPAERDLIESTLETLVLWSAQTATALRLHA